MSSTSDDASGGGSRPAAGALSRCIAIDPAHFYRDVWARTPLLTRAAQLPADTAALPGGAELFGPRAVDELVSRRGLRTPFLRMAKEGTVLPAVRFTRGGGAGATIADQVADDKVLDRMADGATLVLQALHRTWPPIVEFASALAAELGHPAQVNAYVTPPANQGFAPHFDTHDVFVLQIAGRKHWTIHEPVLPAPLPENNWERYAEQVEARAAETPTIDTVLEPGDVLYLPRGWLHAAKALGDLSIHLTVGIHPVTRRQITRELLAIATEDPRLRESLPAGVDLSDPDVLAEHVRASAAVLTQVLTELDRSPDTVTVRVADRIGAGLAADTRPEPLAPLRQAEVAAALTPATALRLRRGLRATLSSTPEAVSLRVIDKTITMPPDVDAAVKVVLAGAELTPAALPGLGDAAQLALAGQLLRDGVLVPVAPDLRSR